MRACDVCVCVCVCGADRGVVSPLYVFLETEHSIAEAAPAEPALAVVVAYGETGGEGGVTLIAVAEVLQCFALQSEHLSLLLLLEVVEVGGRYDVECRTHLCGRL